MQYHSFTKHRRSTIFLSVLLASVFVPGNPAQTPEKKPVSAEQDDVIKVTSNLVNLDVVVKDRKGRPITDLKAEDFTVSENGTLQKIEFFDSTLTSANETAQPGKTVSTETVSRTPSAFPRNIIALVLDGQSTELANLKHVREGMVKYIRERISDTDSVALFSISGGLKLLQPFTRDKPTLIAAVENAYDSSIVSKTAESRDIAANIDSLRSKI